MPSDIRCPECGETVDGPEDMCECRFSMCRWCHATIGHNAPLADIPDGPSHERGVGR